ASLVVGRPGLTARGIPGDDDAALPVALKIPDAGLAGVVGDGDALQAAERRPVDSVEDGVAGELRILEFAARALDADQLALGVVEVPDRVDLAVDLGLLDVLELAESVD